MTKNFRDGSCCERTEDVKLRKSTQETREMLQQACGIENASRCDDPDAQCVQFLGYFRVMCLWSILRLSIAEFLSLVEFACSLFNRKCKHACHKNTRNTAPDADRVTSLGIFNHKKATAPSSIRMGRPPFVSRRYNLWTFGSQLLY